jgi:hypothetical protein
MEIYALKWDKSASLKIPGHKSRTQEEKWGRGGKRHLYA